MKLRLVALLLVVARLSSAQSPAPTAAAADSARRIACPLAQAPDSIVSVLWDSLTAPANLMTDAPSMRGKWVRNVMLITFDRTATQADRLAVIALIHGEVVGNTTWPMGECEYIVRIPYALPGDSISGPVLRAFLALHGHPSVTTAYPAAMFNLSVIHSR